MTRAEVDLAMDWAADEGWNPGIYDAEGFYQADKQGFLMSKLNGEPIGCISAVAYDERFAFLGLYIVKPQFRGQGFGIQLWNAAMAHLGSDRNIGLDGVIAQQENYQKSGFQLAYRHIRYQGMGGGIAPPDIDIVKLSAVSFEELIAYDRSLFPAERPSFLRHWIQQPESAALGIPREARLVGYGVIRACRTGCKIGPLFADDPQVAEGLFQALVAQKPDVPVFLDTPDANPAAIALARRHGMKPVFETARMYSKEIPQLTINRVFGVTSLELG